MTPFPNARQAALLPARALRATAPKPGPQSHPSHPRQKDTRCKVHVLGLAQDFGVSGLHGFGAEPTGFYAGLDGSQHFDDVGLGLHGLLNMLRLRDAANLQPQGALQ